MKTAAAIVGLLLPCFAALLLVLALDEPITFVREGGVWTFAVLATLVLSGGTPALAALTSLPRLVIVGLASLPILVGAAGSFTSSAMVAEAIANVNPADRLIIMAAGTGEVASIFILACVVGGAVFAGTGVGLVGRARTVGGAFVVGAGFIVVTLGVRWGAVRGGLQAMAMAAPQDRMTLLAWSASMAQTASFVLLGVTVVATVAAVAVALTRRDEARQIDNLLLAVGAVVVVGVAAATHLRLNSGTEGMSPLPKQPLVTFHGDATSPPSVLIGANRTSPLEGGVTRAFAVEPAARGIDIKRAVRAVLGVAPGGVADVFGDDERRNRVEFVGPLPVVLGELSLPQVIDNVLAARVEGVAIDAFVAAGAPPVTVVVAIGDINVDLGVPMVRYVKGTAVNLDAGRAGVVFADDVDAATFAEGLSAIREVSNNAVLIVSDATAPATP